MLLYVEYFTCLKKKIKIIFEDKERPAKDKFFASKTPHSVSLREVRLCTVLVNFGFPKI